jgi:hypothetical protein
MKYRVKGAIRDTGEELVIDVTATSDYEAMAIASKLKLLVESVDAIIQPKAKTVAACQGCGIVIEPHGVLRVIGEGCFCPDCYARGVASAAGNVAAAVPGVKATYDKFEDKTTVKSDNAEIKIENPSACLQLFVTATFQGRTQVAPVEAMFVSLLIWSMGESLFPNRGQAALTLWFDGYRLPITLGNWSQDVVKNADGQKIYTANAIFVLYFPIVSCLLRATQVEAKLDSIEMALTSPLQKALGAVCQLVTVKNIEKTFLPPLAEGVTTTLTLNINDVNEAGNKDGVTVEPVQG